MRRSSPLQKLLVALAATLTLGLVESSAQSSDTASDTPAFQIDGEPIPLSEFRAERQRLVEKGDLEADSDPLDFAQTFLDQRLLARTARASIDPEDAAGRIEALERRTIVDFYKEAKLDTLDLSEERLQRCYEWNLDYARVRQVVRETRAEAESVMAAIEAGADMAELARKTSIDEWSAERDGLTDLIRIGQMRTIDELIFTELRYGEVYGPVETYRGWHVIRLEYRETRERLAIWEQGYHLFKQRFPAKLRYLRWKEWHESGGQRYGIEVDEDNLMGACKLLVAGQRACPEDLADRVIASGPDYLYTIADAFDAANHSDRRRPGAQTTGHWRIWLLSEIHDDMIVRDAKAEGFLENPELQRALARSRELALVEALFVRKVEKLAEPSEEDLRRYFTEDADSTFFWRETLDLTIFRSYEESVADSIGKLLVDRATAEEIRAIFPDAEYLATGLVRDVEGLPELSRRIRFGGPEKPAPGHIMVNEFVDGMWTSLRIEEVGAKEPMTFEEARDVGVLRAHFQSSRMEGRVNARLDDYLDSLRVVHDARMDTAIVLQVDASAPKTSAE